MKLVRQRLAKQTKKAFEVGGELKIKVARFIDKQAERASCLSWPKIAKLETLTASKCVDDVAKWMSYEP